MAEKIQQLDPGVKVSNHCPVEGTSHIELILYTYVLARGEEYFQKKMCLLPERTECHCIVLVCHLLITCMLFVDYESIL